MYDYLINHALQHVWCSPRQDLQVIFKPAKIGRPSGTFVSGGHLWDRLKMPTPDTYYHFYQIGQLTPTLIGLLPQTKGWVRFDQVMFETKLIADLYLNNGLHLSRGQSYYQFTEERNLVIAVADQPRIADLRTEPIFIRLYSNAFFSSPRSLDFPHQIYCYSTIMTDLSEGLNFQSVYDSYKTRRGKTWLYVDGMYQDDLNPNLIPIGAQLELVYDSSVKQVLYFPLATAPTFDSVRDLKRKYLLHYTQDQIPFPMIDYRDDIEVYLTKPYMRGTKPGVKGVYYHKNQDDALRMVTHRDYALCVPYVFNYQQSTPGWNDVHELTATLFIRETGWQRALVDEANMIQELYRLPADQVLAALSGVESTVTVWQAPVLENSAYCRLMDIEGTGVTAPLVQEAYGYYAIAKLIGNTPMPVEVVNGRRQVTLAPGLQTQSTLYEYDAQGVLLDFFSYSKGAEYTPVLPQTQLVEGIVGRWRPSLNWVIDQPIQSIDPQLNYRFYRAPRLHGQVQHQAWEEVTVNDSVYSIAGNTVAWSIDLNAYSIASLSDLEFLSYRFNLGPANGLLKFSIGIGTLTQYIPPGKLELWLNGRGLIEGLDFYVQWPEVVIVNKEYLIEDTEQQITVRCTGFCGPGLQRMLPWQVGFVRNGILSTNARYDLLDNKLLRVLIKGGTFPRDALVFSEDDAAVRMDEQYNGAPYLIDDIVVPFRSVVDEETTYTLRAQAQQIDQQISNYLSLRIPEPVEPYPNMSLERYRVYSPFTSTIIQDLVNDIISMDQFEGHYSDQDVMERLESYRPLLAYDPAMKGVDDRFVVIHAHPLSVEIGLNIYQYNFLSRAVHIFLNDRVDLSRFVIVV